MKRAALAKALWIAALFAGVAAAQGERELPDCTSPQSIDDPRCGLAPGAGSLGALGAITNSRIPVIRDSGVAPGGLERSARTPSPESGKPAARPEPPEPPTEFQKFVEQATGALLLWAPAINFWCARGAPSI
ncbi:MAG: hypothetical protein LAQ30_16770 [Acidobacteriia bacterium]|nr:hypothetical protein [Terriglobia bacterium]